VAGTGAGRQQRSRQVAGLEGSGAGLEGLGAGLEGSGAGLEGARAGLEEVSRRLLCLR
jgi:hypothetical protein